MTINWKDLDPEWVASHRYDYYMIDQYRPGDGCHGTYGAPIGPFRTKRLAEWVANELNAAYAAGKARR